MFASMRTLALTLATTCLLACTSTPPAPAPFARPREPQPASAPATSSVTEVATSATPVRAWRDVLSAAADQVRSCEAPLTSAVRQVDMDYDAVPPDQDSPWHAELQEALDRPAGPQEALVASLRTLRRAIGYLLPNRLAFAATFPDDVAVLDELMTRERQLAALLPARAEAIRAWSESALEPLVAARRAGPATGAMHAEVGAEVGAEGQRLARPLHEAQLALARHHVRLVGELVRIFGDEARVAVLCREPNGGVTEQRLQRTLDDLARRTDQLQRLEEE